MWKIVRRSRLDQRMVQFDELPAKSRAKCAIIEKTSPSIKAENRLKVFYEFFLFIRENKKWWLIPLSLIVVLLSMILYFGHGSAVSPFVYTLF